MWVPPERIQRPAIFRFIVAENVNVPVVRKNLEALIAHPVPPVENLLHLVGVC